MMFVHQDYGTPPPQGDYRILEPETTELVAEGVPLDERLAPSFRKLGAAGVRTVLLLRGSFVGVDALGLARKMSRIWPDGATRMRTTARRMVDAITHDAGNFDEDDIATMRQTAAKAGVELAIESVPWSGENHHAGRADGAVRLMQRIHQHEVTHPKARVLVITHSHGGNVAALASQLWSCGTEQWDAFLRATRTIYRSPLTIFGRPLSTRVDQPVWDWAIQLPGPPQLDAERCDVVTMGCPVRYGWGPRGRLAHFTHHVIIDDDSPWRTTFPPQSRRNSANRCEGDEVQQFGIAGTNFPISWLSFRAWRANRRLRQLLQPNLRRRDLLTRLQQAVRLHNQGVNLLTNYSQVDKAADAIFGHAVYTRRRWLAYHFAEIAKLYS